jgi:hypothetical protein
VDLLMREAAGEKAGSCAKAQDEDGDDLQDHNAPANGCVHERNSSLV